MKKFDLNVNYELQKENAEGKAYTPNEISQGNAELSNNYIETAVLLTNKDGLDSQFRRLWVKIQSKIQTALNAKEYVIELEQGEYDFIKKAIVDAKFNPTLARYVVALEDAILSV
jgi:hypothetical protein